MAEPLCRPPNLTLSVHGAREGPAPRAQVSLLLALPCPLFGLPVPLGGAGAPSCSTSPGAVIAAVLVKPKAKRPRAAAGRCCSCVGVLPSIRCRNKLAHLGPARCAYRGQRRSRTWQSHRATHQASPLVETAREKDPRQGLRCLCCGPSCAPYPGSPILSGAPTLSPAPHPLATSQ